MVTVRPLERDQVFLQVIVDACYGPTVQKFLAAQHEVLISMLFDSRGVACFH